MITGSEIQLFQAYNGSSGSSTTIQSNASGQIRSDFGAGGVIVSEPVLRDPAAWYHIIFAIDTTQSTNTNRGRLFLNGTQLTLASATWPNQNTDGQLNDQVQHAFMSIFDGRDAAHFDGYMARAAIYDGLSIGVGGSTDLTPFGEVTDDGFWQINDVSGLTFGDQGVLMEGGAALAAGTDSSGNSNDFTKAGTITATNDGPTNSGDFGNFATLNSIVFDAGTTSYSEGNLRILNTSTTATSTPVTISLPNRQGDNGLYYAECRINAQGNDTTYLGAAEASSVVWQLADQALGYIAGTIGIRLGNDFKFQSYSDNTTGTLSDIVGVVGDHFRIAFDTNTGKTWIGFWDVSADAGYWLDNDGTKRTSDEPADGTNANYTFPATVKDILFGVSPRQYQSNNGDMTLKIEPDSWLAATPSGAVSIATQNLLEPDVINPDEHFFSKVVDHDGSSTDTTCGFNLETNEWLAIIKNTTGADEKWYWINSLRGVNKYIQSNDNDAEATDANVLTVSGTTFTLGSTLSDKDYYVEIHKAGLASAKASNTTGSINTIATSANTVSGFSLVEYTGNETAGATIGHGLSVAPEYLFCKQMNASDGNIDVFHISLGGTKRLFLQTTAAVNTSAAGWNDTAPSSSVITLGDGYGTNKNNVIYVAYVWHGVNGYSSIGTWVANGNADGPFTNLGGSPQSMIIKDYVGAANWEIFSTAMSPTNPMVNEIFPNTEGDIGTNGGIDFTSTGIKVLNTGDPNNSGRSYIYGAFGLRALTDGGINQGRAK